ncbi:MAG: penicillin acylase family protein, partial [Alphaproteobacteria bacterium]|nr:penicillin acylase family protein [Alphaproteobacteria bacterium]
MSNLALHLTCRTTRLFCAAVFLLVPSIFARAEIVSTLHDSGHSRLKKEAQNVTITRDDWGIPHVHGKTDADAVFGMIYAQCEDSFVRVEDNYLTALG